MAHVSVGLGCGFNMRRANTPASGARETVLCESAYTHTHGQGTNTSNSQGIGDLATGELAT